MTRTVKDMLTVLDYLAVPDSTTREDFWKLQQYVEVPQVPRPKSFLECIDKAKGSLHGIRIAIPKMFIGKHDPKAQPIAINQDIIDLWRQARQDLEALGATVVETDFPLVTNYEDESVSGKANNVIGFEPDWNGKERGELVAYLWDDFLRTSGDPKFADGLGSVDGSQMFPRPANYVPDRYMEHRNFMDYPGLVAIAKNRNGKSIWDIDGIAEALPALEAQRKRDFEDWMDTQGIDIVVFPSAGDVGRSDVDTNDASAKHALQNGVRYSIGNRAIRHMGIPTVSVTMGPMKNPHMPVNLTFAGKHGQDTDLLINAYEFEQRTRRRFAPPVTPILDSDRLDGSYNNGESDTKSSVSQLRIGEIFVEKTSPSMIQLKGSVHGVQSSEVTVEVYVDGKQVPGSEISFKGGSLRLRASFVQFDPPKPLYGGVGQVVGNINIIILARCGRQTAGQLIQLPQRDTEG